MCPPIARLGLLIVRVVAVAAVTVANVAFSVVLLDGAIGSKFVPATLIAVPATPIPGAMLVIVGAPEFCRTVNGSALVEEPAGTLTAINPVVAPAGTETTSVVGLALVTAATVPLNVTVS